MTNAINCSNSTNKLTKNRICFMSIFKNNKKYNLQKLNICAEKSPKT